MDLETATTATADTQGAVRVLVTIFVMVVAASATVMVVAMRQRQYRTRFVSGQILAVSVSLPALWLARYDSTGLPRVATILGVFATAFLVLKYRSRWYQKKCLAVECDRQVSMFADRLELLANDKEFRTQWMPGEE